MTKWVIILCIALGFFFQACDYKPVSDFIERKTGKSPYDWGYIAGVKTRHFFTGEKHD